jgi:Family of unknown function (DUF6504)
MRRYDDPVEVRKGAADGWEGPEQFLWRGKLWKVRSVLAHWVETGSWWQSTQARAVIGSDDAAGSLVEPGEPLGEPVSRPGDRTGDRTGDLLGERELWRVEAAAGMPRAQTDEASGGGVFDLSFDWSDGTWQLVGCVD